MNNSDEKEYSESDLRSLVSPSVNRFESITGANVEVDLSIVDECFRRLEKTLGDGFTPVTEPNIFKLAGTLCFWFRKLKPFRLVKPVSPHPLTRFVNETISIITAYDLIFGYLSADNNTPPNISSKYFYDLVVSLRYHSFSPHSLVQIFEGLNI